MKNCNNNFTKIYKEIAEIIAGRRKIHQRFVFGLYYRPTSKIINFKIAITILKRESHIAQVAELYYNEENSQNLVSCLLIFYYLLKNLYQLHNKNSKTAINGGQINGIHHNRHDHHHHHHVYYYYCNLQEKD